MIGHDQHRESHAADMALEPGSQRIDLALEARADIVDRSEE
jgi:hypothetical protein